MSEAVKIKELEKEQAPSIFENRLQLTESIVHDYFVTVEEKVTREDINRVDFWAHVAKKFRPFTKLRVTTDDAKFYAELLVVTSGSNWAAVRELCYHDLQKTLDAVPDYENKSTEYEVAWKGPTHKFCIIRKSDSAMIKKELPSRDAANTTLTEYIRAIAK